jgi:hypothetical protein
MCSAPRPVVQSRVLLCRTFPLCKALISSHSVSRGLDIHGNNPFNREHSATRPMAIVYAAVR